MDAEIVIGLAYSGFFVLFMSFFIEGREKMATQQTINRTFHGLISLTILSFIIWFVVPYYFSRGTATDDFASVHLTKLLGPSGQATLLSVLIALAAYTSTVLRNLRDAAKTALDESSWVKRCHAKQLVQAADIWLVLTGTSMAIRTGCLAGGYYFAAVDRLIIAFMGAIMAYFAFLHFLQWKKDFAFYSPVYKKPGTATPAPSININTLNQVLTKLESIDVSKLCQKS